MDEQIERKHEQPCVIFSAAFNSYVKSAIFVEGIHRKILSNIGFSLVSIRKAGIDIDSLTYSLLDKYWRELLYEYEEGKCNVFCKIFDDEHLDVLGTGEYLLQFVFEVFVYAFGYMWRDGIDDIEKAPREVIDKYLDSVFEEKYKKFEEGSRAFRRFVERMNKKYEEEKEKVTEE